jgi:arsenate reductase (thioredoxin)
MKFNILIFISFIVAIWACTTKKPKNSTSIDRQTILFICEHGAGRSAIAATYFNKIAESRSLHYQAIFRGVEPQEALGISTKNGLIKDSIDITNLIPTRLVKKDIHNAFKIITLDCTLPDTLNKVDMKWTGIQMNGNYLVSKKQIILKVDSLIAILPHR